jgi:hypothetical protein
MSKTQARQKEIHDTIAIMRGLDPRPRISSITGISSGFCARICSMETPELIFPVN